ncbi:MAG TPA: hypothetical protein VEM34_01455 [Burkholderiales bacterium]|nr:hypothetical protein [Burkholderiales bacterium]
MANLFRRLNPTRAFNGLWRHGDFVRLWTSLDEAQETRQTESVAEEMAG